MFREYDVVQLKQDLPSAGLISSTIGTVLMVYPSDPVEYEVEFVDKDGNTLAILTMREDQLQLVKRMS